MEIPEIVKLHILKHNGRMPETQEEIDAYLDLINHAKEYETAFVLEQKFSKSFLKKYGIKSTEEVKKEGEVIFKHN